MILVQAPNNADDCPPDLAPEALRRSESGDFRRVVRHANTVAPKRQVLPALEISPGQRDITARDITDSADGLYNRNANAETWRHAFAEEIQPGNFRHVHDTGACSR